MNHRTTSPRIITLLLAGVVLLVPSTRLLANDLSEAQEEAYRVWLHNLEQTVVARTATGLAEEVAPFPFGVFGTSDADEADGLGLRIVANELNQLEARGRVLRDPSQESALHALTRARSHGSIAEFDSALVWYVRAAARDTSGAFVHELGPETMAVAVAAADSQSVTRRLLAVLGRRDHAESHTELVMAYRYFLARSDTTNLLLLTRETSAQEEIPSGVLAYWHALATSWLEDWDESLRALLVLIDADGYSHELTDAQRAWVLVAIPDLLTIAGNTADAGRLYHLVARSQIAGAREWAGCQYGVLELLAGRFLTAGTTFESLCNQRDEFPWRSYACEMSGLADEMEQLRNEGTDHGVAAHFTR